MADKIKSHPLKWTSLKDAVERSGMDDPDVWIEDLRRYGPCADVESAIVCEDEDTDGVEASFSTIIDVLKNRIVIRHHF